MSTTPWRRVGRRPRASAALIRLEHQSGLGRGVDRSMTRPQLGGCGGSTELDLLVTPSRRRYAACRGAFNPAISTRSAPLTCAYAGEAAGNR